MVMARLSRSASLLLAALACATAACAGPSGSTSTGGSSSTIDPVTAQSNINQAYDTLFNLANKSVGAKLAVIQNGSSLREAITQALRSSLASSAAGAKVDTINLLDKPGCQSAVVPWPCAKVIYDILGTDGQPIMPN